MPVRNWCPEHRLFGCLENWERRQNLSDPPLSITRFPLQRGYSRFPLNSIIPYGPSIAHRLAPGTSCLLPTLICTAPFYAPVAEQWPGKVVYYLTDLTKKYDGVNEAQVIALDRRMCSVAHAVCPNSKSIARYLVEEAACDPRKITVVPNATRAENVPPRPLLEPCAPPADIAGVPRPIIGVIGNLAANIDWHLLAGAIARTREVSWVFVGPYDMPMRNGDSEQIRRTLLASGGRVRFLGARPYPQLRDYARSFDAALIPYANSEPTISGSATRFYEHLAACRPILASRCHRELLDKEPFLKLVSTGIELALEIERLRETGFRDGVEERRWLEARKNTWSVRARVLLTAAAEAHVSIKREHRREGRCR